MIKARLFLLATALLAGILPAAGQDYPTKTVRIVTGYAPGGASDILARMVAQKLTDFWSRQVVVENRPGASGNLASEYVKSSPPDGYTLQIGTSTTHVLNPITLPGATFDPLKDFSPITPIAIAPISPARSFVAKGKDYGRIDRAGESTTGQTQLRIFRHDRLSRHRIVQGDGRHRDGARAVEAAGQR